MQVLKGNLPGWQMMQELCSFFAFPTTFAISTSPPPCLWPTMSKCQVLNCICVTPICVQTVPAGPICMFFVRTPDQSLVRQFLHCLLDHIATLAYSQYILAQFYFCLYLCFVFICICILTGVLYVLVFALCCIEGRGCLGWCHIGLYAIAYGGSRNAHDAGGQWCGAKL